MIGGRLGGGILTQCRLTDAAIHAFQVTDSRSRWALAKPSPAFEGLDTTHGREMLLLSSSRSCLGTRCFFPDEHSFPLRAFLRFPASLIADALLQLGSIGDSRLSAQTSHDGWMSYSASLTPAHYQSDRTAPPGRPGLTWNAPRSSEGEAASWPPTAPSTNTWSALVRVCYHHHHLPFKAAKTTQGSEFAYVSSPKTVRLISDTSRHCLRILSPPSETAFLSATDSLLRRNMSL